MEIVRHESGAVFLAAAGPYLREHETTNHLICAVSNRDLPGTFYATVGESGVALQTPPYPLLVSELPTAAIDPLIELIVASGYSPTGVNGPPETARAFASRWCARHDMKATPRVRMRSHVLERVTPATRTRGTMRQASDADVPMIVRWSAVYFAETRSPNHDTPEAVTQRLLPNMVLWEHEGAPVSMGSIAGRTPRGRRIGYVFTPEEHRRRGHAEALVAAMSERILADGSRWCFLYTDVENPTSNAIYQRIGYEPNGEIEDVAFEPQ